MRLSIASLVMLAACHPTSATPAPSATVSVATTASAPAPSAPPAPTASEAPAALDPYSELPALDTGDSNMLVAQRTVGFSKDDKYLGYEISTCDPCPSQFFFTGPGVPPITMRYFYDPSLDEARAERERKRNDTVVDKKLASLGASKAADARVLRGPFPKDLIFRVKTEPGKKPGTVALLFGARVVTKKEPVYPIRIELGPHPMFDQLPKGTKTPKDIEEWHAQWGMSDPVLAYANVTKDGREIGVVALASGSMWYEAGDVARMDTATFAKVIYGH